MKLFLIKILPGFFVKFLRYIIRYRRLSATFLYDLNHYYKHSMSISDFDEYKLISQIVMDTHVVEKGLTMPDTKLGFGSMRVLSLLINVKTYIEKYGCNEDQLIHAVSVLKEYVEYHKEKNFQIDKRIDLKKYIADELLNSIVKSNNHELITKTKIYNNEYSDFFTFSASRFSIRNYSNDDVEISVIRKVLDHSRNTPSACNRQSVRLHLYTDKKQIEDILSVQGGNRGFGHLAKFLICITFEPSKYFEQQERNLGYVDGGMYAMNILYGVHAEGLAACILNASHCQDKDKKMRKVASVPQSETFVAFIVGGHPPNDLKIAKSKRYPLDKILKVHSNAS